MNDSTDAKSSIELLQLTDLHLLADPGERLGQWHTQASFDAVLADIQRRDIRPDAIVLTGDLVHDKSPTGYRRLAAQLRDLDTPVLAIPGNHDDPATTASCLHHAQVGGTASLASWTIHLLDSHIPASDAGRLGASQLQRLRMQPICTPNLIVIHHPPAPIGSDWIDALRLEDGDSLLHLARGSGTAAIVCGHVHQACDAIIGGVRQITTPSTCRQFTAHSQAFAQDTLAPGYRHFVLHADGSLSTHIRRVPAARIAGLA